MSTSKELPTWTDADSPDATDATQVAVQTTFRHMAASQAVTDRIHAEAQKLLRYFGRITHCHVVIAASHRHRQHGRQYAIRVEIGVPGERLVVDREPALHVRTEGRPRTKQVDVQAPHKDVYVVIREVFDAARRQLEDYARRHRGDVKFHQSEAAPKR